MLGGIEGVEFTGRQFGDRLIQILGYDVSSSTLNFVLTIHIPTAQLGIRPMKKTIPDVYIIESLDPDDEGNGRFEGSIISHVLRLHGKNPVYTYVRTRHCFEKAIIKFRKSGYRYLHISAHGDREGMCTTNQDEIDYDELAEMLSPALENRRLFLSACSMIHEEMAAEIIPTTSCVSIVGPRDDVEFTSAAVFWPAIYHLMFKKDGAMMRHQVLKETLKGVSSLFSVDVGYYSRSKKLKRGYTKDILSK